LKNTFQIAALFSLLAFLGVPFTHAAQNSPPGRPDGIFTPTISPVVSTDKTGRPMTVAVRQPEPRLAQTMLAGNPTGDSYIIHFPQGDAGGSCIHSGTARYLIEGGGELTFQILADCGTLRRGYSYMICKLDASLRCREAPWWYFRDRTYIITKEGITVNGSTLVPWRDAAEAPQLLQKMSEKIKALNDRFSLLTASNVGHGRSLYCRDFHPETKSYRIYEFPTICLVKTMCDGMPNLDALRDGDPLDLNSAVGSYVKQHAKVSDVSNWLCWTKTQ
jgi:hypothetical protein